MTKSLPQLRWSFSLPARSRPRPASIFALWAAIVLHLIILGYMLLKIGPGAVALVQPSAPPEEAPQYELVPPPPPPPPPEQELVRPQPERTVSVPVTTKPPPVPISRYVPEPDPAAVADPEPPRIANLNLADPLLAEPTFNSDVGDADLRSGIDYQCRGSVRYPIRAERLGLEGSVRLRARIRPNGSLAALDVAQSSGHRILDRAATKWLSGCQFSASAPAAGAVERVGELSVHFVLQ